jgi:hypothetical protein
MLHQESDFISATRITGETLVVPKSVIAFENLPGTQFGKFDPVIKLEVSMSRIQAFRSCRLNSVHMML